MDMRDKIAVFCSARYDIDPEYNEAARLFVSEATVQKHPQLPASPAERQPHHPD